MPGSPPRSQREPFLEIPLRSPRSNGKCHLTRFSEPKRVRDCSPSRPSSLPPLPCFTDRGYEETSFAPGGTAESDKRGNRKGLGKGIGLQGETLRPPMHIDHLSQEEADAIVAYRKSLPKAVHSCFVALLTRRAIVAVIGRLEGMPSRRSNCWN